MIILMHNKTVVTFLTELAFKDNRFQYILLKAGQRVLRSHRTNDGEKDKERTSPQSGGDKSGSGQNSALNSNKSPQPSGSVSSFIPLRIT